MKLLYRSLDGDLELQLRCTDTFIGLLVTISISISNTGGGITSSNPNLTIANKGEPPPLYRDKLTQ